MSGPNTLPPGEMWHREFPEDKWDTFMREELSRLNNIRYNAAIAQLAEQGTFNSQVEGSLPSGGTSGEEED